MVCRLKYLLVTQYNGYSLSALTVSELSARANRKLWVSLVIAYPLLFAAFGWGVLQSAKTNRALRIVGLLIIAYCIFNIYWPPMHQRGVEPTLTDSLHISWAIVTVLTMITMMGFGAMALGKRFRVYTFASNFACCVWSFNFIGSPDIAVNGPHPGLESGNALTLAYSCYGSLYLPLFF